MEDGPIEHLFSATLRIFGKGIDFDELERSLGLTASYSHRSRQIPPGRSIPHEMDMWQLTAPVARERKAAEHVDALWQTIGDSVGFLRELQRRPGYTVDVYLSYYSNWPDGGVVIPAESLKLFTELGVPFGLSIVATGSAARTPTTPA